MMSEGSIAQTLNLERWMSELPEQLKNLPFIYLAIPGSHDSMTYGITRSSGVAPDAEPIVKKLYPFFRGTILRWTITQAVDATQQLLIGIRYLDLRLATKTGDEKFYFTHGVYANEITEALHQVKHFVDTHPGEVVILDFQHFYGFTPDDHQRLMGFLLNLYGPQLVPRQIDLQSITLNSLARLKQQDKKCDKMNKRNWFRGATCAQAGIICCLAHSLIMVVYRHRSVYATNEFWQPQMMPSPWPQQDRVSGLLDFLRHIKRHPGMGFVHQAVLTPTPAFIVLRWMSNLRDKCAIPVKNEVLPELMKFSPGPPLTREQGNQAPVNVVIADFVEMDNAIFSRTIIQLNMKLLKNVDFTYHSQ